MAKKGGPQQLQADISTDEEFEKFLERPGLLVLDVYSDWSGPCTSVVSNLKQIKLQLGGDNLQLAICKSDTITALDRFRNRSEPTWLFVTNGKAVNIMFGVNVPHLMELIATELKLLNQKNRIYYEITELQPIEVERLEKIRAAEEEGKRIEREEENRKRRAYLDYCTKIIMENLSDYGVTIFGPQVNRDMFKKLMEPGDLLKLSCKDRQIMQITPEHINILHYASSNPIHEDVLEQIYEKDLLICLWKIFEEEKKTVEDALAKYCQELTCARPVKDENGMIIPDETLPPIIESKEIKIKLPPSTNSPNSEHKIDKVENDENADDPLELINTSTIDEKLLQEDIEKNENDLLEKTKTIEKQIAINDQEEIYKIIEIPPVWTPSDKRTNAAAIYIFFRHQTTNFLPPDPAPIPPHLIVVFDAHKRKDVIALFDKFKDDILLYGYFTTEDPTNTKLLANSTKKYIEQTPTKTDKLIIKVGKQTSHCVLALAAFGPTYVSPNTVEGKKEAKLFFPDGYKTGEMEEAERGAAEEAERKKREAEALKAAEEEDAEGKEGKS